ncbi:intraflagellar transport-associated protein isoform X2 [Labeo rohita]|uniref:intraflagellar transport-associated protein isoform X2 n=1 Tax=Labeo rohita TaxID=84645 RepID=UPI0021E2EF37|nr:intraflagellar transport-associated protein isoform X2 [Labeo rohita]
MPGLVNGSVVGDHDQALTEALEQFCNSPEQTYEQFLSTFTYLTPENVSDPRLTAPRGHGDPSQREMDSSRERQREHEVTEMEESVYRRMGQANRCSPTADQEEFDNYLEDSEAEEENAGTTATSTLPGEIEEDLIAVSSSSLCHRTLLEISSTFIDQNTHTPSAAENQDESEEVVPFHLDENFDYDNVVLSRKYAIQEQNGRPS